MEFRSNTGRTIEAEETSSRVALDRDGTNDELRQLVMLTHRLEALQKELVVLLAAIETQSFVAGEEVSPVSRTVVKMP